MTLEPMKNAHMRKRRGGMSRRKSYRVPRGGEEMGFEGIHRGCADKTRFKSKKTVRSAAERLGMGFYRCRFCGDFHLTSRKEGDLG